MALSKASLLRGLVKNSRAPAFMACTDCGTSPKPVMKMIGMSMCSSASCFCNSRPFRPGSERSRTRQLGTPFLGWSRNSCADANVSGFQFSSRTNSSSDSRTDTSSSTMNTMGTTGMALGIGNAPASCLSVCAAIIVSPPEYFTNGLSGGLQSDLDGRKESRFTEWFQQKPRCALLEHSCTNPFVFLRCDKYYRDLLSATLQLLVKFRSTHARHSDVEDQTARLSDNTG